ncbi:MAG TPA: dihydropteroate synthase [Pseudomonadales bacterium]|nr:dihydropteroate synthase [Pseudomonadales bacterium]
MLVAPDYKLQCGSKLVDLSRPVVMGVLNVTPDSFSDGGRYQTLSSALSQAETMAREGAVFVDVGGESTRPGALSVSLDEELFRVIPVIEAISKNIDVVISVDTSRPQVMQEAARAGAGLINDVRALGLEGALEMATTLQLPVCLMHMQGQPQTMQKRPAYTDVVRDVLEFLVQRAELCKAVGMDRQAILLDPGLGFGKTPHHNLSLLKELEILVAAGYPVLIGASRKSMIGAVLNKPIEQRMNGGLAIASVAALKGAKIIRTHDVAPTVEVLQMTAAIMYGHAE